MKEFTEDERKHLDYLQAIITRMNTNSFQIKGFVITIVSAFIAIFASTQKVVFISISGIPILIFWLLDSFYLQQERKFRGIYNDVIGKTHINNILTYEMPVNLYKGNGCSFVEVVFSRTIFPLYFILILMIIGSSVMLVINKFAFI